MDKGLLNKIYIYYVFVIYQVLIRGSGLMKQHGWTIFCHFPESEVFRLNWKSGDWSKTQVWKPKVNNEVTCLDQC